MPIPKVLFQTSREPIPDYVLEMLHKRLPSDWQYLHFNHEQREQWMQANPHPDFPDLMKTYHSYTRGAHQADLFRYYYLFMNGGMYLDSDAMLESDPDQVCAGAGFVGVINDYYSTFNGFLACVPGHQVIYRALGNAYATKPELVDADYYMLCRNLYYIIAGSDATDMNILREDRVSDHSWGSYDAQGRCVVMHYPNTKVIPPV